MGMQTFSMFSAKGNTAVRRAIKPFVGKEFNEKLWNKVDEVLWELSKTDENAGEATDTAVREVVYGYLEKAWINKSNK